MERIFLADKSQRTRESTAAKPPETEAAVKAAEFQATFPQARRVSEENAQANLDDAIATMVYEGGPIG